MATEATATEHIKLKVRFSRSEWILLLTLAAIQFCNIVDFMIMMPLGPQLMRIFNIGPDQFGLLVSSYTFAAGISSFFVSFIVDRFDRKRFLLFLFSGFCIGTLACAIAPNYIFLLIARFTAGTFGGVLSAVVYAIAYDRRGSAMGIIMGSFSLASVAGVPFSLFLANQFGWHSPFLFLGIGAVILMLLVSMILKPMRGHLDHGRPKHSPLQSLKHIFHTKAQTLALLFMFCLVMGQFTIIPFLSPSLVANTGMTEAQLPLLYFFGGIVSLISSPTAGRLADRYGKGRLFSISVFLSMIPIYFITHMQVQPLWLTLVICCSFFLVMSGRMVPAMAILSGTANPEYRGSFMTFSSSIQQLAAALASYLAAQIIVKDAAGHLLNYEKVGYIAIGFSLLAYLAALGLKK